MTIKLSKCRSCGAEMMWARAENSGKRIPLDAEPTPTGNVILCGYGEDVVCRYLKKDEPHDGNRYTSHFASCPQAQQWRKR